MKKISSSIILMVIVLVLSVSTVFAQGSILETPNVKIVIDGNIGKYDDVPISVDGRTLLPLRALLTNLGVQNDNEHIAWNSLDSSVTIKKDAANIYLKVGSISATINGEESKLDVSPINYKGKVYIPTRFIAQALGKKVIWDESAKSVLIRDEKDFNKIKDILDKSTAASEKNSKFKFNMDGKVSMSNSGKDMDINLTGSGEFDKNNKIMHMLMSMVSSQLPQKMELDYYFSNKAIAMKNPLTNEWQKIEMPQAQLDKMFANNYNSQLKATETLCAGLVLQNSVNPDEFVLKGDVYMEELLKTLDTTSSTTSVLQGIEFEKYNLEVTINKNTNLVTKETVNVTMNVTAAGVKASITEFVNMTFDYNSNFEIAVPKEVQ